MNKLGLNISFLIGSTFMTAAFAFSLLHATDNVTIYINVVAFIIVFGGLGASVFMMLPLSGIKELTLSIFKTFFNSNHPMSSVSYELLCACYRPDVEQMKKQFYDTASPAVRKMIDILSRGMRGDDLQKIFRLYAQREEAKTLAHASQLLVLSKIAPALGLVGTLMGMIVLLNDMGSTGQLDKVGPAMAIALCATMYGVIVANMFFIPIAENFNHEAETNYRIADLAAEVGNSIKKGRHPVHIKEFILAHLDHSEALELERLIEENPPHQNRREPKSKEVKNAS